MQQVLPDGSVGLSNIDFNLVASPQTPDEGAK
jgi:hypothetical protein